MASASWKRARGESNGAGEEGKEPGASAVLASRRAREEERKGGRRKQKPDIKFYSALSFSNASQSLPLSSLYSIPLVQARARFEKVFYCFLRLRNPFVASLLALYPAETLLTRPPPRTATEKGSSFCKNTLPRSDFSGLNASSSPVRVDPLSLLFIANPPLTTSTRQFLTRHPPFRLLNVKYTRNTLYYNSFSLSLLVFLSFRHAMTSLTAAIKSGTIMGPNKGV